MKSIARTIYPHSFIYAVASFGMTFLRLAVAFYAGASILYAHYYSKEITIISILFIMIFDHYDGVLFNKSFLRSVDTWRVNRRILDSIVDRSVIQIVCIPLVFNYKSFLWIYLVVLLREIIISGYLAWLFKKNILLYPGPIAKLACALVGITTIGYLTMAAYAYLFVALLMLMMSFAAFIEYKLSLEKHRKESGISFSDNHKIEIF